MKNLLIVLYKVAIGVILFAGLPLLAWGPGDVVGFLSNPARLIYLIGTVVLQFIIVIAFPNISAKKNEGERTVCHGQFGSTNPPPVR
jgi:hypothetical protein